MDLSCVKSKNLMEAVQKNRQEEILTRLRLGEKVDAVFTMGRTALHCAAANSNIEAVSTLMMYSPDLKICDTNGNTALHIACSRSGSDSEQIIEKLISSGAELGNVNKWRRTVLHECVISNNVAGAKIILESGVDKDVKDSEGRTARELAINRESMEMVELLSAGVVNNSEVVKANELFETVGATSDSMKLGACALPKKMTVEEEKEVLRRRLAELEEGETKCLENSLKEKRTALDKVKIEYRKQREVARNEIFKLEQRIKVLQNEEEKKTSELEKEMEKIASEIDKKKKVERPEKNKDIESCLECPVCLDVCKPPLQVWQCPEGHIICGSCVDRPELRVCPQCRISLTGQLSRNRALEDLARKTFPREAEKEAKKKNRGGGGGGRGRSNVLRNASRRLEGGRRAAQVQSQVDQLINFSHLGLDYMDSEFDDDAYDLTSELFLENVDDEFMPNFPSSVSPISAWRDPSHRHSTSRNSALLQRINSMRSSGTGRRRSSPEVAPHQRPRHMSPSEFSISPVPEYSPSNSPIRPTRWSENSSNHRNSDQAIYGPHSRGRGGRFRRNNIDQRLSSSRHIR